MLCTRAITVAGRAGAAVKVTDREGEPSMPPLKQKKSTA